MYRDSSVWTVESSPNLVMQHLQTFGASQLVTWFALVTARGYLLPPHMTIHVLTRLTVTRRAKHTQVPLQRDTQSASGWTTRFCFAWFVEDSRFWASVMGLEHLMFGSIGPWRINSTCRRVISLFHANRQLNVLENLERKNTSLFNFQFPDSTIIKSQQMQ
jgi:hypothetical protein